MKKTLLALMIICSVSSMAYGVDDKLEQNAQLINAQLNLEQQQAENERQQALSKLNSKDTMYTAQSSGSIPRGQLNEAGYDESCISWGGTYLVEVERIVDESKGDLTKAQELLSRSDLWLQLDEENKKSLATLVLKSVSNEEAKKDYRKIFAETVMKYCSQR